jgi:hypothetical protein
VLDHVERFLREDAPAIRWLDAQIQHALLVLDFSENWSDGFRNHRLQIVLPSSSRFTQKLCWEQAWITDWWSCSCKCHFLF